MAGDFQSLFLEASVALARLQTAHEREVTNLRSQVDRVAVLVAERSCSRGHYINAGNETHPKKVTAQSQFLPEVFGRPSLPVEPPAFLDIAPSQPPQAVPGNRLQMPAFVSSPVSRRSSASMVLHQTRTDNEWKLLQQEREHKMEAGTLDKDVVSPPHFVSRIVDSFAFEALTGALIFVNVVFIGAEVQAFAESHSVRPPLYIDVMGYTVFGLFLAEFVLRILSHGPAHFFWWGPSIGWSWFDAVVIAMSIVDVVLTGLHNSGGPSTNASSLRVFRVIKIARILRLARIARIVRFVSALRMLIYSIAVSLKSVMWAVLLFLIIIYVFGIVFTQEMVQSIVDDGDVAAGDARLYYWGSLDSAMFTLFKSICGGVDWQSAVEPLVAENVLLTSLFATYIWFTYFVVLNVLTGAFCSSALAAAANDPEIIAMGVEVNRDKREKLAKRVFEAIDVDHSGSVTIGELTSRISDSDVQGVFLAIGIDIEDAYSLFSLMDSDGSGRIDLNEFITACMSLRGAVSNADFVRAMTETKWMMKRLVNITKTLEALPVAHKPADELALAFERTTSDVGSAGPCSV